ncbi:MAG: isopentenyl-diphosphate Delta-isomerase [bacterium]
MPEYVVLVDQNDKQIGTEEKLLAHKKGLLHRAFSVFIFNSQGQMLIAQRALYKYHSAGLWSNACCSHPRPGENVLGAAQRRLQEELGFSCSVQEIFSFIYTVKFDDNGLIEHEYDHVLVGTFDGEVEPNPGEVAAYRWVDMAELEHDVHNHPDLYTYWFKTSFKKVT